MATALVHILPQSVVDREQEERRTIRYGKCTSEAYAANDLWFVGMRPMYFQGPDITYLVSAEHATPRFFNRVGFDTEVWNSVAHMKFEGDWNEEYECIWYETPYFIHVLPDGSKVYFGKSRMRSRNYPNKQLWWLVLEANTRPGHQTELAFHEYYLVDEVCTQPDFIDRMGTKDHARWGRISWHIFGGDPRNFKNTFEENHVPNPYSTLELDEEFARMSKPLWKRLLGL